MIPVFQRHGRSVLYLLLTDYLILVGAFGVAMRLRFRPYIDVIDVRNVHLIPQVWTLAALAFLVLLLFNNLKLYQRRVWLSPLLHIFQIVKGMLATVGVYFMLQTVTHAHGFEESRMVVGSWGVLATLLLLANRILVFTLLRRFATSAAMQRRIVIVGSGATSEDFHRQVRKAGAHSMLNAVGFVSDLDPKDTRIGDLRCLGRIVDLPDMVPLYDLEGAVIAVQDVSYQRLMEIIEQCVLLFGWVDVHADRTACLQQNLDPDTYFDIPFVRLGSMRKSAAFLLQKRILDVAGAGLGILLLSPVFLLAALLIRLTSRGPVIYVSERIGQDGRPFRFYKFRTMVVGADRDPVTAGNVADIYMNSEAPVGRKVVNRSLLTPGGSLLRKWAIDELPQLFNVIKGDMSLVGPRPLPRGEYDLQDEWQKKRFEVQPGCTGLWKIYASRNQAMPFSQSVLYDIYYARNMNPLLDLTILFKTVWIVLTGRADG